MRWVWHAAGGEWVLDAALPPAFGDRRWVRRARAALIGLAVAAGAGAAGAWVWSRPLPPPPPPPGPCSQRVMDGLAAGTLTAGALGPACFTPAGTWVVGDESGSGVELLSSEEFSRLLGQQAVEDQNCDNSGVGGSLVCY
jgi:hypothetical protein